MQIKIFNQKYKISVFFFATFIFLTEGCKKLTEVDPPSTSLTGAAVFSNDANAISALTGIYSSMSSSTPFVPGTPSSLDVFPGLSSDELALWSGSQSAQFQAYYDNNLSASGNNYGTEYWSTFYSYIFRSNDAISKINASTTLTPSVKQQLLGEAYFLRAYFYFYVTGLYGNVPLALTTDPKINASLAQTDQPHVYSQIISDLKQAQSLLSAQYLDATLLTTVTDRVRPTKWAATALLARTYLYNHQWPAADSAATVLINNAGQFSLSTLNNTFLRASMGNNEAIWQLQPVTSSPANTFDGVSFYMTPAGPNQAGNQGIYLSNFFLNAFEPGDNRATQWVGKITIGSTTYYFPYKYKQYSAAAGTPVTEHLMILRLGEQYLIRAEARAMEGNIGGAQADLNAIRTRAGLGGTNASDQASLLTAILHERQVELFTEQGHRWLDLKRSGTINTIMTAVTPVKSNGVFNWNSNQQLYPIRPQDIILDPNLRQNSGY